MRENAYKQVIYDTNAILQDALSKGIKDNVIPGTLRESLNKDVFLFSALKTNAQLFEASRLLTDIDGKIKSFSKFSQDILKLKSDYNTTYLEAEYQFATSSALMNQKWNDFSKNSSKYNLQYRTAGDERVRQSHAILNNTTLPISDTFWKSYFPPNGWRCRCNVVEVLKDKYEVSDSKTAIYNGEKATTLIGKDGKNKLEIFRFNPGMQKVIFPPTHPYSKIQGAQQVAKMVSDELLSFKEVKRYPNNGTVSIHKDVDTSSNDYQRVYQCCDYFAEKGHTTSILPRFDAPLKNEEYAVIFKELENTKYWGKCPDFKVDSSFYEHEGYTSNNGKKSLKNMFNRGLKQSNKIVIDDCGVTDAYLKRNIETRISVLNQDIKEVWVLKDGKLRQVY